MNVEEAKIMRISRQPSPIPIMVYETQLENAEYRNCVGSVITNGAVCMCKDKSKICMAKAAFNKKETFHQQT